MLVDTTVWIAIFRKSPRVLTPGLALLRSGRAVLHPWTLLELRLGHGIPASYLHALRDAPTAERRPDEAMAILLQDHPLAGTGIGLVDLQLLATAVHEGLALWTLDRALAEATNALGLPAHSPGS